MYADAFLIDITTIIVSLESVNIKKSISSTTFLVNYIILCLIVSCRRLLRQQLNLKCIAITVAYCNCMRIEFSTRIFCLLSYRIAILLSRTYYLSLTPLHQYTRSTDTRLSDEFIFMFEFWFR